MKENRTSIDEACRRTPQNLHTVDDYHIIGMAMDVANDNNWNEWESVNLNVLTCTST